MDFSLFYFADDSTADTNRYRLLLEGARFADTHGFTAVWTPERHFDAFGGAYPILAVVGAAIAAVTERVSVRAGSVVAPLHPAVRIVEEWSVVDNLSAGRAGIALASGWNVADFAIRPEAYPRRRAMLAEYVETIRELWQLKAIPLVDGVGAPVEVRTFPPPVQPELPMWLSSAGSLETFRTAGHLGVGLLATLIGHDMADLKAKIDTYRQAYAEKHAGRGHVVLMAHTFLSSSRDHAREVVRAPFTDYLRKSMTLVLRGAGDALAGVDPDDLTPEDLQFLAERAFDGYFETSGLFGTVEDATAVVERLAAAGADEVACLIDFVGDTDTVLGGLNYLDGLRETWQKRP